MAMTEYVTACRTSRELRLIADWVGAPGVAGGAGVARLLRAQADHVDAGKGLATSPLAEHRGGRPLGLRI